MCMLHEPQVTDWNPLRVYLWKQPYLRFASTKYTTDDRSEFVHLVNNSVVAYDSKFGRTNPELETPHYMWFWQKFQRYLHDLFCPHCQAAASTGGHLPAVPDFLHEPPYTCETFGVLWEEVRFVQDEEETDSEDEDGGGEKDKAPIKDGKVNGVCGGGGTGSRDRTSEGVLPASPGFVVSSAGDGPPLDESSSPSSTNNPREPSPKSEERASPSPEDPSPAAKPSPGAAPSPPPAKTPTTEKIRRRYLLPCVL